MSISANVEQLLDLIEETLEEGAAIPLSGGKRVVDVDKVRDYIDEVRLNLPSELHQAQNIVGDRSQILNDANAQAEAVIRKAEERARIIVSEQEVVKAAQRRAAEIISTAQNDGRTLRQTITDYCENMLRTTEETMAANANQIKTVRANLRQSSKSNMK